MSDTEPVTAMAADDLPESATVEPVKVEPGTILCIRVPSVADADLITPDLGRRLANETGALVMVLVGDTRLEALEETDMARHGWVRADAPRGSAEDLARLVPPPA